MDDVTSDVAVEVTDRVLETGGSKNLSVSDLVNAMRLEAVEIKDGALAPSSGLPPSDDPTSSESTITTEFPLVVPTNENG